MPQDIFAYNYPHVDNRANRDGDTRKSDDVGIDAKQLHRDKDHQYRQRQQARYEQGAAQVHDHHQHHDDRNQDFIDERRVQGSECLVDQTCAVVERDNSDL